MNKTFDQCYHIIKKIGGGSFGDVYLTEDKLNNRLVAAKIEDYNKASKIKQEYYIYKSLRHNNFKTGLPKIYSYITTDDYNIMIMELLGESLEDKFESNNKCFKLNTVLMIGIQIIKLLQKLHNNGYLHRDIKPNNFLLGLNDKKNIIHIMDFGLSKKYIIDDQHIPYQSGKNLVGTARYASCNIHAGMEPSRRDDLESVGYMLVYFIKGGLPWQKLKKQPNVKQIDLIGQKKLGTSSKTLCEGLPSCFETYLEYCKQLNFTDEPEYDILIKLFESTLQDYDFINNDENENELVF